MKKDALLRAQQIEAEIKRRCQHKGGALARKIRGQYRDLLRRLKDET